jgi:hypothetical protein
MCRRGTKACFHYSDFQSKNFSYAIFIVKKWPLYVNFSIPPCGNFFFSQCSTPLVGVRFCTHVSNSTRNKNVKSGKPYLHPKMVFLSPKTLLSLSGTVEINFFFDFEPDDLANGKE